MPSSRDYDWRSVNAVSGDGAVAQLVERLLSMQKVCGSIPHCSTFCWPSEHCLMQGKNAFGLCRPSTLLGFVAAGSRPLHQ
jgi:hypothetical protein